MKKSLLAVAAIGAFASAAQAQSSVTVYGILDMGFVNTNYTGTSITTNAANINNTTNVGSATQKQTTAGFGQSAESTSRLGFKGAEDLGGGMKAVFTLETGISPNQSASAFAFNRQAFVGLSKSGLGTATVGTQYTPIFDVAAQTDAAGLNNLVGNAVYSGSAQSSTGTYNIGGGVYSGIVANQSVNVDNGAFTTRTSNALKLQSDRIAGVAGQLFYAQANSTSGSNGAGGTNWSTASTSNYGTNNSTAWGLSADYMLSKLQVVAAYQSIKSFDPSTAVAMVLTPGTTATPLISNGSAGNFGYNTVDNQAYAAATYDFGILKAFYQYGSRKASAVQDSSYYTKRSANQVGVRSQLTPTISAYATFGLTNSSYWGQGLTSSNGRAYQLGVDYYLSKRTNLYVAGGAVNQSSNGYNVAGASLATSQANGGVGISASNYALGIRHTF